mmetsp:Transcript_8393/g.25161  ORF Transcript_8393/g.25161 Transcript_8393/m.25161 type:complete len:230 (+) Transcript_8393:667-1356(+)
MRPCLVSSRLVSVLVLLRLHPVRRLDFHFLAAHLAPVGRQHSPVALLEGLHHRPLGVWVGLAVDVLEQGLERGLAFRLLILLELVQLRIKSSPVLWTLLLTLHRLLVRGVGGGGRLRAVRHSPRGAHLVAPLLQSRPLPPRLPLPQPQLHLRRQALHLRLSRNDLVGQRHVELVGPVLMAILDAENETFCFKLRHHCVVWFLFGALHEDLHGDPVVALVPLVAVAPGLV